ncbi:MAG: hypothetical protein K2H53_02640 [Clostridia bacterium]|nr:hypothetical protein [Clostridia bacterium]
MSEQKIGVTEKEYEITIHRPFAVIKGQIELPAMYTKGIHEADLRLYKSSDINDMFLAEGLGDWDIVQGKVDIEGDNVHDLMIALESQDYKTNEDRNIRNICSSRKIRLIGRRTSISRLCICR